MIKIAVCGCGVVGSGVADILIQQREKLSKRFNKEICLGYVVDIKDLTGTPYEPYWTNDLQTALDDPEVMIVSMTMGGLNLEYQFCQRALEAGKHVVTSNKAVVAEYGCDLESLAFSKGVRFMYEASAGGGIPIIRPLNICLYSNDYYGLFGILNGTTNYMLTKMLERRQSFDDALKDAQALGYAEANPTADVDGFDAARKIAILSSIAYGSFVDYKDIPCTGIRNITFEDLLYAVSLDCRIKLIAGSTYRDGVISASVEPRLVYSRNMLSSVSDVYNALLIKGSYTGDTVLYGKGAGKEATASAVVGDMIEILGRPRTDTLPDFVYSKAKLTEEAGDSAYYIRFSFKEGTTFEEAKQLLSEVYPELVFAEELPGKMYIAVITDPISKETLEQIAEKAGSLGFTKEIALRVLA